MRQPVRELPELEVLRRDLDRELSGKKLTSITIANPAICADPEAVAALDGAKVTTVTRSGMVLLIGIEGDRVLAILPGPDANLRLVSAKTPAPKKVKGKVVEEAEVIPEGILNLGLGAAGTIRLIEPKPHTKVIATTRETLAADVPQTVGLGPDPLEDPETWMSFAARFTSRRAPAKAVLTDPAFYAGVGDLYADEILFEAGLRPERKSNTLGAQELRRLSRAVVEVLQDAVKHRGTSVGDTPFADLSGRLGEHQTHLAVWGRDGQRSPRSHHLVRKVKFEGRWAYFCETQV
jgi:formamidopyrimidine-DNA glycosylase